MLRAVVLFALVFSACGGVQEQPVRKPRRVVKRVAKRVAKPLPKFAVDGQVGSLSAQCTGPLGSKPCDRVQLLKEGTEILMKLHQRQRTAWVMNLTAFKKNLTRPEAFPTGNVVAVTSKPSRWMDVEGLYPVEVRLRLEYSEGSRRHKKSEALLQAAEAMKTLSDDQAANWKLTNKAYGGQLNLGKEVAEQRKMVPLLFAAESKGVMVVTQVPADLLDSVLGELVGKQQSLDVALVVKEKGLKNRYLKSWGVRVTPAFILTGSGPTGIQIIETSDRRTKRKFRTMIPARLFCKSLRAEIRYFQRDERPRVSWAENKRGGR